MNVTLDRGRAAVPIPVNPAFLRAHGRTATETALKEIVGSVRFELLEGARAFRLLGPDMSYHQADPYLGAALARFQPGLTMTDVPTYTSTSRHFDLCFEDSWTGYFLARRFRECPEPRDLLLIHLDDHTDMMPTLLYRRGDELVDPTTGSSFDPTSGSDWRSAIAAGCINIGNFLTPFGYSGRQLHVRHLSSSAEREDRCYLRRELRCYDLIPDKCFAAVATSAAGEHEPVGTYVVGSSAEGVLDTAPHTWTVVHVDLDYFINDFNGVSRGPDYVPDPFLRRDAQRKLHAFFRALAVRDLIVDRWLIGTSPGFCSAYHWEWLLAELAGRIDEFAARQSRSG